MRRKTVGVNLWVLSLLMLCFPLFLTCGGGGSSGTDEDTTPPTIPGNPVASPASSARIALSWSASSDNWGVKGYKIFRDGSYLASATGTSFVDEASLRPKTAYCYSISAYDAAGNESALSVSACATTHNAWARLYNGSAGAINAVRLTADGGYVGAGTKYPPSQFYTDMAVTRLDADGNIIWQKTYGGMFEEVANAVEEMSTGGFAVAGYRITSGDLTYPIDLWLVRLDGNGNVVWQKSYDFSLWDVASSVRETPDGGLVVAGYTGSGGAFGYDFWVLKLDGLGDIQWQKRYGGGGWEQATSIEPTSDGGFIVAGDTYSFGAPGFGDFWVVKLDAGGNVTWQKAYGDSSREHRAYEVRQTADDGYIVAGYRGQDFLAMKLDGDGNILWQKTYGGPGWEEAYSVDETSDGGYFLAGRTDSFGAGNGDMWLVRLNADGEVLWQKTYGGSEWDLALSVRETPDAGCVLAGFGGPNFSVLKLDIDGEVGAFCEATGVSNAAGVDTDIVPVTSGAVPVDTNAAVANTSIAPQDAIGSVLTTCPGP